MQGYTHLLLFLPQNIDCGYSLEHSQRGGSNIYPQSMLWERGGLMVERRTPN